MEKNGHYCYGCEEYFHDSNPEVKEHKDCKGRKEFGICLDNTEFDEFYVGNLEVRSKVELIEMVKKFQGTSKKLRKRITVVKGELEEVVKASEDFGSLTITELDFYHQKESDLRKTLVELESLI